MTKENKRPTKTYLFFFEPIPETTHIQRDIEGKQNPQCETKTKSNQKQKTSTNSPPKGNKKILS